MPAETAAFATCGIPVPAGSTKIASGRLDGSWDELEDLSGLEDCVVVRAEDFD